MGYEFDLGGAFSGGLGGAGAAKMMGIGSKLANPGWLGLGPAGFAMMGLSALAGGLKKKKSVDIPWGKVVTLPQYDFTEGRLRSTSDYLQNNIEALGRGEEMPWISNYYPQIQSDMQKQLRQRYQGTGTTQGTYDIATQAGSISGIGPKAVQANVNKAVQDYQTKAAAIDTEILNTRAQLQSTAATQFPYLASAMPKGPDAQVVGGGGTSNAYAAPQASSGGVSAELLYKLAESGGFENWNKTGSPTTTAPNVGSLSFMNDMNDYNLGPTNLMPPDVFSQYPAWTGDQRFYQQDSGFWDNFRKYLGQAFENKTNAFYRNSQMEMNPTYYDMFVKPGMSPWDEALDSLSR